MIGLNQIQLRKILTEMQCLNGQKKNRNTLKHFTGFINDPITDEQAKLFEEDYEKFREQFYKGSPYFGYN